MLLSYLLTTTSLVFFENSWEQFQEEHIAGAVTSITSLKSNNPGLNSSDTDLEWVTPPVGLLVNACNVISLKHCCGFKWESSEEWQCLLCFRLFWWRGRAQQGWFIRLVSAPQHQWGATGRQVAPDFQSLICRECDRQPEHLHVASVWRSGLKGSHPRRRRESGGRETICIH